MRVAPLLVVALGFLSPLHTSALAPRQTPPAGADEEKSKKPVLSVRATPAVSFSPARVRAVAELKGGPDDYQALYCAAIEWDWGDLTQSEEAADCEPYQEGVSQITRRFVGEHTYRTAGRFRIQIRLKRNNKVLAGANTTVQVRPGVRDIGD